MSRNLTQRLFPFLSLASKYGQQFAQVAWYSERKKTAEFVKPSKRKGLIDRPRHFVDYVKVTVRGGNGGNGMISFSSLPKLEWAGPDGGNGGNGGHVIFKASHNIKSLAHLNPLIAAVKGVNGRTSQRDGKNSPHLIVQVPFGTVIKSEGGRILASLDDADSLFIAARGGAGGKGNYFFLSNENRAPVMAEKGGPGQERQLHVELKTMAHAGLIGFPNAGKSSLLCAISRAQPKVSPYPFTTLNPHIGMVLYDDHQQLAVADIPGLIPGSHLNKGMGHSFLRHIERCLCLVYVIDLSLERPWEQLRQLKYELNQYKDGLADRPALLVANKIDLPEAQDRLDGLKLWMKDEMKKRKKRNLNETKKINVTRENGVNVNREKDEFLFSESSRLGYSDSERLENIFEDTHVDNVFDNKGGFRESQNNRWKENMSEKEDTGSVKDMNVVFGDEGPIKFDNAHDTVQAECGTNHKNIDDILVLAVSAKREIGINEFLHHLRVIYDSHLSSKKDDETSIR